MSGQMMANHCDDTYHSMNLHLSRINGVSGNNHDGWTDGWSRADPQSHRRGERKREAEKKKTNGENFIC